MKTLKLIILVIALTYAGTMQAQVSVNVNLGSPPMWGPVGYSNVQYYYLPDVYAYYDINASMFIYQSNGVWVHRSYLPTRYRNYDLYNGYKVVMTDYHGSRPYYHHNEYRARYAKGYRGPAQHNIGSRPERGNANGHYKNQPSRSPSHGNAPAQGNGHYKNQPSRSNGHSNGQGQGNGNDKNSKKGNGHNEGNGHSEGHGKK